MSAVHSPEVLHSKPVCIGRGSFAQVWTIPGAVVAFKEAQRGEEGGDIVREFKMCGEVYDHCNHDSFFSSPRAIALSVPSGFAEDAAFKLAPAPAKTPVTTHRGPTVRPEQFSSFDNAAYALDLVLPLPEHAAMRLREAYFPPGAAAASGPNLCRLYFGKEYGPRRSQFANTHNFPLDVARYEALMRAYPDFQVTPKDIAKGMGETLGRIHLRAGYDARDIEFVLGGDGGGGFSFWVIDFNQVHMRRTVYRDMTIVTDLTS